MSIDQWGETTKTSFCAFRLSGAIGAKYGTPNDRKEAKWATNDNPSRMPYSPKRAEIIIRINRKILVVAERLYTVRQNLPGGDRYNNDHNVLDNSCFYGSLTNASTDNGNGHPDCPRHPNTCLSQNFKGEFHNEHFNKKQEMAPLVAGR